jgi:glycerophosphoryl diester phosphodiesterase
MIELEAAGTGQVLVIGHRGAMGCAPENTLASFEKGLELGADVLELDVHLSRDGHVVVIHDGDVSRTTDGTGRVGDMTLDQLKSLDAGSWFGASFRGQQVPTLKEVLDWARTRISLAIEIKGDPTPDARLTQAVVTSVREAGMIGQVMLISFHHDTVKEAKALEPRLATGILFVGSLVDTVGAARAANADSVRPKWDCWTAEKVREVHSASLTASTWNADDEGLIEFLVGLGVDSIGANHPDRLRAYLDRIGLSWR